MPSKRGLTRRTFFGSAASAAVGIAAADWSAAAARAIQAAQSSDPVLFSGPVRPFPLTRLRLLSGPLAQAQDLNARYLLSLPPERLLHTFRVNAGLPSSAEPMG